MESREKGHAILETVLQVIKTEGVEWPAAWMVTGGDHLVLRNGEIARVVEQPTPPLDASEDLLRLVSVGALRLLDGEPLLEAPPTSSKRGRGGRASPSTGRRPPPHLHLVP
jgi:hypothetical protein